MKLITVRIRFNSYHLFILDMLYLQGDASYSHRRGSGDGVVSACQISDVFESKRGANRLIVPNG